MWPSGLSPPTGVPVHHAGHALSLVVLHLQPNKNDDMHLFAVETPVIAWSALVCARRVSITDLANLELQLKVQT